jgi:hypothetical protein
MVKSPCMKVKLECLAKGWVRVYIINSYEICCYIDCFKTLVSKASGSVICSLVSECSQVPLCSKSINRQPKRTSSDVFVELFLLDSQPAKTKLYHGNILPRRTSFYQTITLIGRRVIPLGRHGKKI